MINIDKKYPECSSIETAEFIRATIGHNNPANGLELPDEVHNAAWHDESALIAEFISAKEGRPFVSVHRDNVYNHENSFSDVFVFEVFAPEDAADWIWSECYVSINIHRGGDVRGNYGTTKIYHVADCLGESGFFDWCLGFDVRHLDGSAVENSDRFLIGYASNPWYEMVNYIPEKTIHWSEKRQSLVGRYNGRTVTITPYCNAN